MIPAGFTAKRVAPRPDWLPVEAVVDIHSVSGCTSEAFCDYTKYWRHNGFWLFNSPADVEAIARSAGVALNGTILFYYEVYEEQFDDTTRTWESFRPLAGMDTAVEIPERKELQGYDVVSFSAGSSHECSPLSCNGLAQSIPVNRHCLLTSLEEAKSLLAQGQFANSEPGPFRIYAVYVCHAL